MGQLSFTSQQVNKILAASDQFFGGTNTLCTDYQIAISSDNNFDKINNTISDLSTLYTKSGSTITLNTGTISILKDYVEVYGKEAEINSTTITITSLRDYIQCLLLSAKISTNSSNVTSVTISDISNTITTK